MWQFHQESNTKSPYALEVDIYVAAKLEDKSSRQRSLNRSLESEWLDLSPTRVANLNDLRPDSNAGVESQLHFFILGGLVKKCNS